MISLGFLNDKRRSITCIGFSGAYALKPPNKKQADSVYRICPNALHRRSIGYQVCCQQVSFGMAILCIQDKIVCHAGGNVKKDLTGLPSA